MSLARSRVLRPARAALGRRLHALIDSRVEERLARRLPAIEAQVAERVRHDALRVPQVFGPTERLSVDPTAQVNDALFNTVSGTITVKAHALFGHGVAVLTGAYDIAEVGFAGSGAILAAGRDVVIESGASVSSRAVVLGPCRIGADAVVAAGAVVTGDVAAGTVVGGVPAKRLGSAGRRRGLPPATDAATDVGRMYLHAEDEVVTPILRDRGGWDSDETEALRNVLRPGATLVDVGANVGYVTLLGARIVGREGRVVAIEPHPDNLRLLRANVARHGLAHVDVVAGAAWDRSGAVKLSACATNTGDHRVGPVLEERPWLEVPALTLDEVLGDTQVDVLKLDTQATEHVALCGARRVLERCRPVVLTEFWPAGIRELGDDPLDALHLYRELGYRLRVLEASELDAVADEELVARVDQRPAPFGGFVTLLLEP